MEYHYSTTKKKEVMVQYGYTREKKEGNSTDAERVQLCLIQSRASNAPGYHLMRACDKRTAFGNAQQAEWWEWAVLRQPMTLLLLPQPDYQPEQCSFGLRHWAARAPTSPNCRGGGRQILISSHFSTKLSPSQREIFFPPLSSSPRRFSRHEAVPGD